MEKIYPRFGFSTICRYSSGVLSLCLLDVAVNIDAKLESIYSYRAKYEEMAVPLLLTIFYVVLTTSCALVTKNPRNETLSVLLLASTAASFNTSPSTLSKWVNDLLIKGATGNWGYQLQLTLLDTKVRIYSYMATEVTVNDTARERSLEIIIQACI